jgi:DNA-binding NtrC family response regulator
MPNTPPIQYLEDFKRSLLSSDSDAEPLISKMVAEGVPFLDRGYSDDTPRAGARTVLSIDSVASRHEGELLKALTKALSLRAPGPAESTLKDSFVHAMAGLSAQKAALLRVTHGRHVEVELVHAVGVTRDIEASCTGLWTTEGVGAGIMRRVIDDGAPRLVERCEHPDLDPDGGPHSILSAPVFDGTAGAVVGVLYFQKGHSRPFCPADLHWISAYATALGGAPVLCPAPRSRRSDGGRSTCIVGHSTATRELLAQLDVLLRSTCRDDAPAILITGESGTGKEAVARHLHTYSPTRSRGRFVSFNCAGLRGDLIESKLFGHVKGAFTNAVADAPGLFRAADKGVLFLDEVGELPPEGQSLLLRVLETRTVQPLGDTKDVAVDVQLLLATNRRLLEEVSEGRFRQDLFYRINSLKLQLTPLRDPSRIADIRPLVAFHLTKHERSLEKRTMGLSPAAFRAMLQYSWPGNVRELNNVCARLVTYAEAGAYIDVPQLTRICPEVVEGEANPHPEAYLEDDTVSFKDALRGYQAKLIRERLRRFSGNAAGAAASLQMPLATFYRYWGAMK